MVTPIDNRRGTDDPQVQERAGEERMWLCVIMQAIEDATAGLSIKAPPASHVARKEARQWLTKPSRDLECVCSLANVEMQCVIEFAKARIHQADNGGVRRLKAGATGGSQRLSSETKGPVDLRRARFAQNRDFEEEAA